MIVVIGTDGVRPVVWGMGETEEAAREDAAHWSEDLPEGQSIDEIGIARVDAERAARITDGDVDARDLVELAGITLRVRADVSA